MDTKTPTNSPIPPTIPPPVDPMAPVTPAAPPAITEEPSLVAPESLPVESAPVETQPVELPPADISVPVAEPTVLETTQAAEQKKEEPIIPATQPVTVKATSSPVPPMTTVESAVPVTPTVDAPVYPPPTEHTGNKKTITLVLSVLLLAIIGGGGVFLYGMMMNSVKPIETEVTKDTTLTPTVYVTPVITATPTPASEVDEVNSLNITDPSEELDALDQNATSL